MRLHTFAGFAFLALVGHASAGDLYDDMDYLRAGGGICAPAGRLAPLLTQPALEDAAEGLARGQELKEALLRVGYRYTRATAFSLHGDGARRQAATLLTKKYCAQLQDGAISEVGLYRDAGQLWVVLAAPFAPRVGMSVNSAGQRILDLINQARASSRQCGNQFFAGAAPLRWNDALARASQLHSDDMARRNYFSHSGGDGSAPADRVERAGYSFRSTGENIAGGQKSPEEAVAGWIKSPGHCANLMDPGFTEMGAGVATNSRSDLGIYWTQEFGTPAGSPARRARRANA